MIKRSMSPAGGAKHERHCCAEITKMVFGDASWTLAPVSCFPRR